MDTVIHSAKLHGVPGRRQDSGRDDVLLGPPPSQGDLVEPGAPGEAQGPGALQLRIETLPLRTSTSSQGQG